MLLDFAAVRINPERALAHPLKVNVVLTDTNESHLLSIENGVLIHEEGVTEPGAPTVKMARMDLLMTLFAGVPVSVRTASGAIVTEGDAAAYPALAAMIDPIDTNFPRSAAPRPRRSRAARCRAAPWRCAAASRARPTSSR